MLKRNSSLASRAAIVFGLVLAGILLAIIVIDFAAKGGEGDLRGPHYAVRYAVAEADIVDGELVIPANSRLARLLSDNPAMWFIARRDGRSFERGAVTPAARQAVAAVSNVVESSTIRLPGLSSPRDYGLVERREFRSGPVVLATGGIDPRTLPGEGFFDFFMGPETLLTLAIITVISLIAMAVAIPFFTRAVTPIAREAEAIGPHVPDRRLSEDRAPKELLPLVRGFNAVLDRLETELGRRKRFIADAAHELRTPLAVVALQVESLPDGEERADLRRGLRRLTDLVSQMLDLQRLSLAEPDFERIDLGELARGVVADLAPMAIAEGYDLSLEAPDGPVETLGNPLAVERALTNLIVNAIVHAGNDGQIVVEVLADRSITVSDQGPGIGEELRQRVFDPFTQGNQDVGGCGLGLHLTREIMTAHGGEVALLPARKGARFRLVFPAEKAAGRFQRGLSPT